MKALCFLGATQAYDTTYVTPDGNEWLAPFFPAALVRLYPGIDQLRVFVTQKAHEMHYQRLAALVRDYVPDVLPIPISDGRTEAELWQIFQAVSDAVEPGDHVVFDITHGFRSLPFLSFLAAAYLRSVKSVTVEAVLYGAFEAGEKRPDGSTRAPIFDLTRFVTLLDWLSAADRFTRYGDAGDLAALLRDREALPVHLAAAQGDAVARKVAGQLRGAAAAVEDVSLPLRLVRPLETMKAACKLEDRLKSTQQGVNAAAKPFALIADQIRNAYAPFALAEPLAQEHGIVALSIQRSLIGWYIEHKQYFHAVTLAREWLVSYTAHHRGWDVIKDRKPAEHLLSAEAERQRQGGGLPFDTVAAEWLGQAAHLWNDVADLRNDLAHLGFRARPRQVTHIVKSAHGLPARFARLPLQDQRQPSRQPDPRPHTP